MAKDVAASIRARLTAKAKENHEDVEAILIRYAESNSTVYRP